MPDGAWFRALESLVEKCRTDLDTAVWLRKEIYRVKYRDKHLGSDAREKILRKLRREALATCRRFQDTAHAVLVAANQAHLGSDDVRERLRGDLMSFAPEYATESRSEPFHYLRWSLGDIHSAVDFEVRRAKGESLLNSALPKAQQQSEARPLNRPAEKVAAAMKFIDEHPGCKGILIARHIHLAESTFKTHTVPALRKLGYGTREGKRGYHPPEGSAT